MQLIKLLIIVFLNYLTLTLVQAQENVSDKMKNSLSLQIGYENGYLKDLNFSPLNYNSTGLVVYLKYQRLLKNYNALFVNLDFSISNLKSGVSEFNDSRKYVPNLEIGYWKLLSAKNQRRQFFIGAQYHSYLNMVFHDGKQAVTFFGLHGVDFLGKMSYRINDRHEFETGIALPVFGLLVRPPYTGWDKYIVERQDRLLPIFFRGKWTSLNDFFGINWRTRYAYQFSPKLDMTAEYLFRYYKTSRLDKSISTINQLKLGIQFKF